MISNKLPHCSVHDYLWPSDVLHLKKQSTLQATCAFRFKCEHIFQTVWELERFQTVKVTFRVTQGHWFWCCSIGHIWFPISIPCLYLAPFPRHYQLLPKMEWGHLTLNIFHFGVICHVCTSTPQYQSAPNLNSLALLILVYAVSLKTTPFWFAVTSTYIIDFEHFCHRCCYDSKQSNGTLFSHFTYLMLLHYLGKQKAENCVFSRKRWMLFCQQTQKTHSYYRLVTAEPPFILPRICYMQQTRPRKEGSIACCLLLPQTHRLPIPLWCRSLCQTWELFFVEPQVKSQWTVLVGYLNKC